MVYFEDETSWKNRSQPLGVVTLNGGDCKVAVVNGKFLFSFKFTLENHLTQILDDNKPFLLTIETPSRTLNVNARSYEEQQIWTKALEEKINHSKCFHY